MPPKKDKNLAGANPVPQPVPDPYLEERNKFLETFISFVKQWCTRYEITHGLNVLILKDGRYFEEIKEEVIVEQKDPASEFRYHVAEPEIIKKPYSEQFDDIELQNMSLHNIPSSIVEVTQEINIGLGFNKDGILTKFHSEESHIPSTFMNIFVELKSIYHTITKIHLINCNLTAHSVFILGGFLRAYHSVNDVNLDFNHVPEQNFHVLIKGTGVEYLSLKSCKIDCFGAKLIAKILTYEIGVTQNLLSLCLTGNSIHDEGLVILAQSLRCNCTLQHLSIAKNIISDYGVMELAQVLKKFPLKPHEDLDRRFSYIKYLEILELEVQDDTVSNASNLGSTGSTSGTPKNVPRKSRKSKGSASVVAPPPVEPQPREQPLIWNISLSKILESKLHPLLALSVEEADGKIYSVGNFSLRYLNLSYNWLTEKGVNALTEVAQYQASVGTQATGTGLQYIDLEGLYTTSVGEIMPEINLLNKVLTEREIPEVLDLRHLFQSQ